MAGLSESLLQKSFADCSAAELRQLTARYPYFAPAHFLLLKKLDPSTGEYRDQYRRAQLYFHDPLLFETFISGDGLARALEPVPPSLQPVAEVEETMPEPETAPTEDSSGLPGFADAEPLTENDPLPMPEPEEVPAPETATPVDEEPLPEDSYEDAPATEPAPPLPAGSLPDLAAAPVGDINFEPYHTVDYFASQGIKLRQEDTGQDKFGKQLRSFTDWLKTMKRITPENAPMDARAEAGVSSLAGHSVADPDIVTEAMAEVWVKQGAKARAVAIYRKLSLLHPAKMDYFAGKINSLND